MASEREYSNDASSDYNGTAIVFKTRKAAERQVSLWRVADVNAYLFPISGEFEVRFNGYISKMEES